MMIYFVITMSLILIGSFIETLLIWGKRKQPLNVLAILILVVFMACLAIGLWLIIYVTPLGKLLLATAGLILFFVFEILIIFYNRRTNLCKPEASGDKDLASYEPVEKAEPMKSTPFVVAFAMILIPFLLQSWILCTDIPTAFIGRFSTFSGNARFVDYQETELWLVMMQGEKANTFWATSSIFQNIAEEQPYTVVYLPHSKYVIDILDENGKSLLIQPK